MICARLSLPFCDENDVLPPMASWLSFCLHLFTVICTGLGFSFLLFLDEDVLLDGGSVILS